MNDWILFTIGIMIGGMLGVMASAIISTRKQFDLIDEISDLRTQRELLKQELLKRLGIDKKLTNYRRRKNSLSSNKVISLINGYKVYKDYMKMGYLESFYRLLILSISSLKKNYL